MSDTDTTPVELRIISTVPIVCDIDYERRCEIALIVKTDPQIVGGTQTTGFCELRISEYDWKSSESLAYNSDVFSVAVLRVRDTHGSGSFRNRIVFKPISYDKSPFWNGYTLEPVTVSYIISVRTVFHIHVHLGLIL